MAQTGHYYLAATDKTLLLPFLNNQGKLCNQPKAGDIHHFTLQLLRAMLKTAA